MRISKKIFMAALLFACLFLASCQLMNDVLTGDNPVVETALKAAETGTSLLGGFIPGVSVVSGLGFAALQTIRKWRADKKVMAGYQSISALIKKAKAGEINSADDIKDIVGAIQISANLYPQIRADLEALWKKGKLLKV